MSQRNWKTTQRKTNRNVLQNFASRPISALSSIKESSTTATPSIQTSTSQSSHQSSGNQEGAFEQDFPSSSSNTSNNDIYQIIEDECHNANEAYDGVDVKSPPKKAFQYDQQGLEDGDIQELIDFDQEIEKNHNLEAKGGESGAYDDINEDDDSNPIIYAHHDDDSISQITSSVAGYSMYSTDHALSKQLNSTHNSNRKVPTYNHGGVSHMRPNTTYASSHSFGSSQNSPTLKKRHENTPEEKSPLMEDEELNKFFAPADGEEDQIIEFDDLGNVVEEKGSDDLIDVDIYTNDNNNDKRYSSETQYDYHRDNNGGDDLTLRDMYSIEPSLSNDSRRTFTTEAQNDASFTSFLLRARLKAQSAFIKAKHVINKYIPTDDAMNFEQKKNDDIDQEYSTATSVATGTTGETDYFGMLMSSSFVSTSSNASLYRFRNRKENEVNFIWISCLLVLIWLLLYLAKLGNDSAWEQRQMQMRAAMIPNPSLNNSGLRRNGKSSLDENINVAEINTDKTLLKAFDTDNENSNLPQSPPADANIVPVPPVQIPPPVEVVHIQVDSSHIGMPIPDYYNNILDVTDKSASQVPFFWHIPRTAGATINEILSVCYHLRVASNGIQGHEQDTSLELLNVGGGHSYVNVDLSSSEGIKQAVTRNLVSSGLSDVLVSSLINEAPALFDPGNKGRIFTMIRHPVMRAASLFYFLQDVQWKAKKTYNEELANISIHDFFKRKMGESNWLVRYLSNQVTKPYIDETDLKLAKEILRRKVFVGLTSEREASFNRFQKVFGWNLKSQADVECLNNRLQWDWALKHPHQIVKEGTELWDLILAHNKYDVELFEYAKVLFQEQGALV